MPSHNQLFSSTLGGPGLILNIETVGKKMRVHDCCELFLKLWLHGYYVSNTVSLSLVSDAFSIFETIHMWPKSTQLY